MTPQIPPTRLADAPAQETAELTLAARLVRDGDPAPLLSPQRLAEIEARVFKRQTSKGKAAGLFLRWKWALVSLLFVPVAMAAVFKLGPLKPRTPVPASRDAQASASRSHPHVAELPLPERVESLPVEPVPASVPQAGPGEAKAERRRKQPVRTIPEVEPETPPLPLRDTPQVKPGASAEARMLASALEQLHRRNDPGAALQLLETYEGEFPQGVFRREATLARIDSLFALDRRSDVLMLLKQLSGSGLDGWPRAEELRVLQAELLAELEGCPGAMPLLDSLVAGQGSDAVRERALLARGGCKSRGGDPEGAQADLRKSLELFPAGRFHAQIRRALETGL